MTTMKKVTSAFNNTQQCYYDLQEIYKTDTFLFQCFCVECNCTVLVQ